MGTWSYYTLEKVAITLQKPHIERFVAGWLVGRWLVANAVGPSSNLVHLERREKRKDTVFE